MPQKLKTHIMTNADNLSYTLCPWLSLEIDEVEYDRFHVSEERVDIYFLAGAGDLITAAGSTSQPPV